MCSKLNSAHRIAPAPTCPGVLLVADDTGLRKLRHKLQGAGATAPVAFHGARGGDEAVALLRRLEQEGHLVAVGVLHLDSLGEDAGLRALRALRATDPRVLWVTVTARRDGVLARIDEIFCEALDDWDCLTAPFTPEQIQHKVRQMVAAWNRRRREEQLRGELCGRVADLAHQINNPLAYVQSNLHALSRHAERIARYAQHLCQGEAIFVRFTDPEAQSFFDRTRELRSELKLDFVLDDLEQLVQQSLRGTARLHHVVRELSAPCSGGLRDAATWHQDRGAPCFSVPSPEGPMVRCKRWAT